MVLEFDFYPKKEVKPRNPVTSKLAHESVKEHKQRMYDKIVVALEELKVGATSEEVSKHLGMPHEKVWKRYSELLADGIIFNTGITRVNSSGRKAQVRQLCKLK